MTRECHRWTRVVEVQQVVHTAYSAADTADTVEAGTAGACTDSGKNDVEQCELARLIHRTVLLGSQVLDYDCNCSPSGMGWP